MTKSALDKLKAKGVAINVIRKAEVPEPINAPIVDVPSAAPEPPEQTKPKETLPRTWKVDNVLRNYDGWIVELTITETT